MSVIDPLTTPSPIEGIENGHGSLQVSPKPADPASGAAARLVAPKPMLTPPPDNLLLIRNSDNASTSAARPADIDAPVAVPKTSLGRRSLMPLMHWEGVVERVEGNDFYARLTPFEGGSPNLARIEYTDFTLDDLANPDDRRFVEPGARFYWTVGRATNAAGSLTNVSLVRFRRLAPPSSVRRKRAEAEADALLEYGRDS
jgi:hypothetical protein